MKKSIFSALLVLSISVLFITACESIQVPEFLQINKPTSTTNAIQTATTPTPSPPPPESVATQQANLNKLIIWVPPLFDPTGSTSNQSLLQHIEDFKEMNPGVEIEIRVKSLDGAANLITSLEHTLISAPMAAPSLILLPDYELQIAANENLIQPLLDTETFLTDEDWYDYARQLAQIQNQVYGLPFAADAMIIVYRQTTVTDPPNNWEDILSYESPFLFPAADSNELFPLNLYISLGGEIYDDQRHFTLDTAVLQEVLEFFAVGAASGSFPSWLSQYEDNEEVWKAFNQRSSNWALAWTSDYLSKLPVDVNAIPIPSIGGETVTLVSGWLWALSDPYPERHPLSLRLLEHMVSSEFLADWTPTAGYLPVRPSSMSAWQDQIINSLLSKITLSARSQPPNEILDVLNPTINEAVYNVLINQYTPAQAARDAGERLNSQ